MKTLGIIGGIGPETTAKYYQKVSLAPVMGRAEHRPEILISSVPIGYPLEQEYIARNKNLEKVLRYSLKQLSNWRIPEPIFLSCPVIPFTYSPKKYEQQSQLNF